jgi:hypothetical protein
MKIPEILSQINLNEEQIQALDTFFKEWTEEIKTSVINEGAIPEGYIKKEDGEKAFNLYTQDAEKAFELFKEDSEKAFELAKQDWQEEFNGILEAKQNQYTEAMAKAMQDIYEEIEVRVKNDFMVSEEYKAFQKVKDAIVPVVISESQKEILDKIKTVEEKEAVLEANERELSKNVAINTLLQDFPQEYVETVKKFISKASTEAEVYERFNTIVEMVDKGLINKNGKATTVNEDVEPATKATFRRKVQQSQQAAKEVKANKQTAQPVFESATGKETKPAPDKSKGKPGLTDWERTVIGLAFPQQTI